MGRVLTKRFWIINILFIVGATWLIAHLFVIVIRDRLTTYPKFSSARSASSTPAEKPEPYDRYGPITERNIFNPGDKGLKLLPLKEKKTGGIGAGEDSASAKILLTGNYRLVGTITGSDSQSWAILEEGANRKQRIYRFHENIDGGKIIKISRDRILIQRQGKEEVLSLMEEEGRPRPAVSPSTSPDEVVKKLSANRFLVNREDVTASVANINQFMTQARFRPYFVMSRPSGFSVSEIKQGSLMEKIGLRNNDVIKKVNGQVITRPEEVFQAYSQLQRDSNIEVEIERNGQSEVFWYEIR